MNTVALLGALSLVLCVAFTWRGAYSESKIKGQSLRDSLKEAWTNIAIGFSINYTANFIFLPLVGAADLTAGNNFWLGCIYTALSFVRNMVVRRYFNKKEHEAVGEQK